MKRTIAILLAVIIGFALSRYHAPSHRHGSGESLATTEPARWEDESRGAKTKLAIALGLLTQESGFRQMAQLGEIVTTLSTGEIEELANRLDEGPDHLRATNLAQLVGAWAQHDPASATRWMADRLDAANRGPGFALEDSDAEIEVLRAWASGAPEEVVRYAAARLHSHDIVSRLLHFAMVFNFAADAESLGRWALLLPPGEVSENIISTAFLRFGQSPDEAYAVASNLPDGFQRDLVIASMLRGTAETDPITTLDRMDRWKLKPLDVALIIKGAAISQPETVAIWLEQKGKASSALEGVCLVSTWAQSDPLAAFAWAEKHGISLTSRVDIDSMDRSTKLELMTPLDEAMKKNKEVLGWVLSRPPGPDRDRYIEKVIHWADADALAKLVPELPEDLAKLAAVQCAVPYMGQWRLDLAAKFTGDVRLAAFSRIGRSLDTMEELPAPVSPGPDRDAVLRGMVFTDKRDPEEARKIAAQISDPRLRQQVIEDYEWVLADRR